MSLNEFIAANHKRIDKEIRGKAPGSTIDDRERSLWVRHDRTLNNIARQCGVQF